MTKFWEHIIYYRKDPIPGTGKARGYNVIRFPQTTQERRCSCEFRKDKLIYMRAKRNKVNLPDSWDDIKRSNLNHRSWKHQTKKSKQYMKGNYWN